MLMNFRCVLLALFVFILCGCQDYRSWDLSKTPPFDAYIGQEIKLNVACVLYSQDPKVAYGLVRESSWESVERIMGCQSLNPIFLPPGSTLFLENSIAFEDAHLAFKTHRIRSVLRNPNHSELVPKNVPIYYYTGNNDWNSSPEGYLVNINVAPWEPLDTQSIRTILLPKKSGTK